MDSMLVVVTLVSLALASAMGLITWRIVAVDRRREDARVAALVALASEDDLPLAGPERPGAPVHESRFGARFHGSVPGDLEATVSAGSLFSHDERESPAGRRLVAIAAVAAVMAVGIGTLVFTSRFAGDVSDSGSRTSAASTLAAVTSGSSRTLHVPLELMSLRHERDGDRLTISGLVRNPRYGTRVERANAVASVFDSRGTFVAGGRALVDFLTLEPGDESPFVVTVTAPGPIGRYRIGFRGQDGAVVGHVDRRAGI